MEPKWISVELALLIHNRQLAEHGGQEGIRDMKALQSALARPQNLLAYESPPPTLSRMAAAYALGIAKNHPFVDENKRTAAVVCMVLLEINGFDTSADEEQLAVMFENIAAGLVTEDRLAVWLEQQTAPSKKSAKRV